MNKTKLLASAILFASLLCAGCDQSPQQALQDETAIPMDAIQSERVKVTRLSVVKDGVAYNNRRATYLIVDTETGKEFIGVSGIGIVETGSHTCGKGCIRSDER